MSTVPDSFPAISRQGRGSRVNVSAFSTPGLRERHQLPASARSSSTEANVRKARKLLTEYSIRHAALDPSSVTCGSSLLILNLLAEYCRLGTEQSLKNDTMGGLIQGLRIVYEENGHFQSWACDEESGKAKGNPLIGNPDIVALRRAHRVHLARIGILTLKARPLTAEQVCSHAERFWFGSLHVKQFGVDARDVQLHAIFLVGLNLGLRFDELSKLKIEHVSVNSRTIHLTLREAIKNSTEQRDYVLREWPGNTALRHSLFMDPIVALLSWMVIRGSINGALFCDVKKVRGGCVLDGSKPLSSKKFTDFFRLRLKAIGVGPGDLLMYSGHSVKRGAVQLYRSLNLRDEQIMELIQMKGPHAYANYCAAYNDCAPLDLPRFSSVADFVRHAEVISRETAFIHDDQAFSEFLKEIGAQEEEDATDPQ